MNADAMATKMVNIVSFFVVGRGEIFVNYTSSRRMYKRAEIRMGNGCWIYRFT